MTIDELRSRHRELLARKKEELALQAEGRGDNLALFMVQEELLEVNAQLRALTPQRRVGGRRVSHSDYLPDRQQFMDWDRENHSLDDEIEDGRRAMLKAVTRSWEVLTPKQRQIMELSQAGVTQEQIAIRLGVNKSTVSRTLGRAKRSMREEAERSLQEQKLDARHLDMADPATAKVILSAMTPKQAAYLYLYYAEWMSLREISELTETDHSTIYRTICRALRNIGSVLGYQETVLENIDAMDDLAYQIYSEIQGQDAIVPSEIRPRKLEHRPHNNGVVLRPQELPPVKVRTPAGRYELVRMGLGHRGSNKRRGRLLEALLARTRERASGRAIMEWLLAVFRRITGRNEKRGIRWWQRIYSYGKNGHSRQKNG